MSTEVKFESHNQPAENISKGKVKLTDLLSRLNEEKKKERNKVEIKEVLYIYSGAGVQICTNHAIDQVNRKLADGKSYRINSISRLTML